MATDFSLPLLGRISRERFITLFKFMLSGLPSFIVAVPLNYFLVEKAHLGKNIAYALVIAFQVAVNFFVCRAYAFNRKDSKSMAAEFGVFFSGIMLFRVADWALYVLLVNVVGLYYLAVQLCNVVVFALLKFFFSEKIFVRGGITNAKNYEGKAIEPKPHEE
jgi:putative flippase GtrA